VQLAPFQAAGTQPPRTRATLVVASGILFQSRQQFGFNPFLGLLRLVDGFLARIIREVKGAKSLLCYKHVVETMFEATKEAFA
jgi:hypothetical protein